MRTTGVLKISFRRLRGAAIRVVRFVQDGFLWLRGRLEGHTYYY